MSDKKSKIERLEEKKESLEIRRRVLSNVYNKFKGIRTNLKNKREAVREILDSRKLYEFPSYTIEYSELEERANMAELELEELDCICQKYFKMREEARADCIEIHDQIRNLKIDGE